MDFKRDLLKGLSLKPKSIPSLYFYDDKGSELFQKITKHSDYYLTNAEIEILSRINLPVEAEKIDLIELGPGDGQKGQLVIRGFLDNRVKVNYFPIDISSRAIAQLRENIQPQKNLKIHSVLADYFEGLRLVRKKSKNRALILFLGSNIGNFNVNECQDFLKHLGDILKPGDFTLIGFDLKKDINILNRAYNDPEGLTRDFNLNLLDRINRELGGSFDKNKFKHLGSYNQKLGAMESFLISQEKQQVFISQLDRSFDFEVLEPIHMEYSFKYLKSDIEKLASQAGFEICEHFNDSKKYFIDSLWKVPN
jgi:L-histidine Nalpha-methyltransferase